MPICYLFRILKSTRVNNMANLREWLFKNRLSVTYLAKYLGINRSYVHMWMSGRKSPSDRLMTKIRELSKEEVSTQEDLIDEKKEDNRE